MTRRQVWDNLTPADQRTLRQIRDLDAEHVRLSGVAPPRVLAGIRARRDQLIPRQETPVTFADLVAKEVERAGSQSALAREIGISQSRISSWLLGNSSPTLPRMRELVTLWGYDWTALRGSLVEPATIKVAPRSLTIRIPQDLQEQFGLEDGVPERVRRRAWEAAAEAFQAVIKGR
jgi:transcriptional regulator with XRE-family HTH domain